MVKTNRNRNTKTNRNTKINTKINTKLNFIKTLKKNNIEQSQSQYGGKFIGKGSYGCVIKPFISCNNTKHSSRSHRSSRRQRSSSRRHSSNNNNTNSDDVSKILLNPDEDLKEEIKISKLINNLDPDNKYFITFKNVCNIKSIPDNRTNIVSVKYKDESLSSWHDIDKKKKDKKYCPVDLRLKPINLIMPFGGYDLLKILEKKKDMNMKLILNKIIYNLKDNFKNMLIGLYKLHQNHVVIRDIKLENILANYNKDQNKVELRFIDFGLASHLNTNFTSDIDNIFLNGTFPYISPEQFITFNINQYYNYKSDSYILNKIMEDINENTYVILSELKEYEIKKQLSKVVYELFEKIKLEFKNNSILVNYFGIGDNWTNGYLQKGDIYGLGLTIFEFLDIAVGVSRIRKNVKLYDLLKKMIELDPNKRYNVIQCLKHPYFT
jgi:serine/threonine protein kinase